MTTATERKLLEHYLSLKYPITIHAASEGGYVAEIEDLPGCLAQGETLDEVYELIEESRRLWLEVAFEDGQEIPEPRTEQEYSGKFFIRAPRSLHRKLDQMAKQEGVSLNQFLVATLSRSVGIEEGRKTRTRRTASRSSATTKKKLSRRGAALKQSLVQD
ncbi:MAG: type II toxin-antitoxin system HicB family antitoxin [Chloroflexi bacterium]|nr:type II toxin-antitoxin system HicB family antitoxin [Chloroflexota bacterium]